MTILMRRLTLCIVFAPLLLSHHTYAQSPVNAPLHAVAPSTDVEATMKSMALTYKQAMQSTDPSAMLTLVEKFQHLVASVQQVQFDKKHHKVLHQGLDKVQTQLDLAHASIESKDIKAAKAHLKKVAVLRKRYHKERSPDIWQLIFG
ncbi:hypothetical protein FX988_03118 [Paraglaciecola mesophila]|uniref:Cytochrome b562 n=1 Tax=Paraglaciecola mesophila TaxID=197222 RepID=A0A857JP02_9ALTE|nr:cytochrome b562 [Paraglaciecola mesophila]QHJ12860.1 hypothetical protein FX988_03118 [Paraglaciecola mesophila]